MNMNLFKFKLFFEGEVFDVSAFNFDRNLALKRSGGFVDLGLPQSHIMQYTGYTAKGEQEIYTGMILKNHVSGGDFEVIQEASGELILSSLCSNTSFPIKIAYLDRFEIIGTIWDKES